MSSVRKHQPAGSVENCTTLPYHLLLVRDREDKAKPWTAAVEELPGCTSHGKTSDEALDGIKPAMTKWIGIALSRRARHPRRSPPATHSGRLLLRMPKTLHADLTRASEREGVSLNQFITDVLASAIVWRGRADGTAAGASRASPLQAPGAEGLTTERGAASRGDVSAMRR